jgi:EpsI family protein
LLYRILVVSAMLALTGGLLLHASRPEQVLLTEPLIGIPLNFGVWQGRDDGPMEPRILKVLGVDDYISRSYISGTGPASLYVGFYKSQRQGDAIHSPMNCLPGAGWNPASKGYLDIETSDGRINVNRVVIQKGIQKQLALYWYQSHGRVVASEYRAKVFAVLDALRTNRTDAALVRVITPVIAGESESEARAVDFVQRVFPYLVRFLPS